MRRLLIILASLVLLFSLATPASADDSLRVYYAGPDVHDYQREEDEQRTRLEAFGYRVIRFKNIEVETDADSVLQKILEACRSPLPKLGEGQG